jgi:general secretion pathway protein K
MDYRLLNNRRGMALLLTITISSILVTVTLALHRKVRSAVVTTAGTRDRMILYQMAEGGIHAAMALMVKDKMVSTIDSLQEDWADPEKIETLLQETPFEKGKVTVVIEDERARIQVNALVSPPNGQTYNELQRQMWERYLNMLIARHEVFEDLETATVLDCLKDWMDSKDDDAITGLNGAESGYYEDLDPPSFCRNGPIKHPAELLRIKGITPELYYGTEDIPGLSRVVTVFGMHPQSTASNLLWDGKININTAPLPVLTALLPLERQDLAEVIDEYRKANDNGTYLADLTSPTWYKSVPGLSELTIPADLITVSSDVFRITASAAQSDMKIRLVAVVSREKQKKTGKWMCRVLSWRTE